MNRSIVILPVGGTASRMLGLPKFMLPASNVETLIERHCRAAFSSGFNEVHIVTRGKYFDFVNEYIAERKILAQVHQLPFETKTMSETLRVSAGLIPFIEECSVTIALADTAFYGTSYSDVYHKLLVNPSDFALGLFQIREDQFGKLGQVEINSSGRVLSMLDKDPNCFFPHIWGLAKVPGTLLSQLDISNSHIGIEIEKLVANGEYVAGVMSLAEYFDCGTFEEYCRYLTRTLET